MPQLNPAPWFSIMVMAWTVLLIMLMPKLINTQLITTPPPHHATALKHHWPWPWY
uniref:ATP synthase complex subunit 8 n=1 Tax=Quedenfeldtia moerens TaxID=933639 RepID=A0A343J8M5_9SAUR|nr:ATP synthase F0 subunit 8 [Quedenfeldtia moerens]